jgi:hypothetical protein
MSARRVQAAILVSPTVATVDMAIANGTMGAGVWA